MKKRILWISDIHLNQEPSADSTQVISSFINSLNQFDAIDYLVISGDVAQSGSEEAHYMQFESKFIAPFKLKFPNAKVFSVPGNHDVDWKWAEFHLFKEVIAAKEPVNLF